MNSRLKVPSLIRHLLTASGLLFVLFVAGCGESRRPAKVATSRVTGKVTFKIKRPAIDVMLSGYDRTTGDVCSGKIADDGSCTLTMGSSPLIPEGTYDLALSTGDERVITQSDGIKIARGEMAPPKRLNLPSKYTNRNQTGWWVKVAGESSVFEIVVGP
jgi:hypothetical protein